MYIGRPVVHSVQSKLLFLYKNLTYPIVIYIYNLGHILVDICELWQKFLVRELAKSGYFRSAS